MDRSRAELAARLLRLAGVTAKVRGESGGDGWHVKATTGRIAAGREELRNAIAKLVETARVSGLVDEKRAKRWLEELKKGRVSAESRPGYLIRLDHHGTLVVKYQSTKPDRIEREAQRLENMGLTRGVHFTVKMPEGGGRGYVWIRREGLAYAAWLSVHGKDEEQRRLATAFVEYILQRAKEAGEEVYEKAREIIEEGKSRGSLKLEGFEKRVEVNGKTYVVKVIGGEAELEKSESGKLLLRIRITAEVDGIRSDYTITFGRYSKNAVMGYAYARADAEGLAAVVKALTGMEPWVYRMKDGTIKIACGKAHLDGFMRYTELADAIEKWLEETGR
jgi:Fe2+ transport system protein FeoA